MLSNFTLIELGSVIVSVMGALAMLCGVITKSRCDKVNLCCGLINCHRKVPDIPPPDIETGAPSQAGQTIKNWKP